MSDETLTREFDIEVREGGDGRTLVSRLVPYNEVATVNDNGLDYREEFLPGAFNAQLRAANRVKAFLNFRHRQGFQDQVGHAKTLEDKPDGLHAEMRVFDGPDGDKALQMVREGIADRLSIEFQPLKSSVVDGVVRRISARLVGVALVPQGSYPSAGVLAVREAPEEMPEEQPVSCPPLKPFDPVLAKRLERFVQVPPALLPVDAEPAEEAA